MHLEPSSTRQDGQNRPCLRAGDNHTRPMIQPFLAYPARLSFHPSVRSGNALFDPLFQFLSRDPGRRAKLDGRQSLLTDEVVHL